MKIKKYQFVLSLCTILLGISIPCAASAATTDTTVRVVHNNYQIYAPKNKTIKPAFLQTYRVNWTDHLSKSERMISVYNERNQYIGRINATAVTDYDTASKVYYAPYSNMIVPNYGKLTQQTGSGTKLSSGKTPVIQIQSKNNGFNLIMTRAAGNVAVYNNRLQFTKNVKLAKLTKKIDYTNNGGVKETFSDARNNYAHNDLLVRDIKKDRSGNLYYALYAPKHAQNQNFVYAASTNVNQSTFLGYIQQKNVVDGGNLLSQIGGAGFRPSVPYLVSY